MANELEGISIPFFADTAQFERSLRSVRNSLSAFASQTESVVRAQDKLGRTVNIVKQERAIRSAREQLLNLQAATRRSSLSIQEQDKIIRSAARSFAVYNSAMRAGELNTRDMARAQDRLRAAFNAHRRVLGDASSRQRRVNEEMARAGLFARVFGGNMTDLSQSVQVALGPLSGVASRISAITALANRNTAALAGVIGALIGLGHFAFNAIKVGANFQRQMVTLEARIQATGGAAGFTAEQFDAMAHSLARDTLASVEGARQAIISLTTATTLSGDQFERALRVSQDAADAGFGTLEEKSRQLARALADPKRGMESLSEWGVRLSRSQKDAIETMQNFGDTSGAIELILKKLEDRFKGTSDLTKGTLAASIDSLVDSFTQLQENVTKGGVLPNLADSIDRISAALDRLGTGPVGTNFARAINLIFGSVGKAVALAVENIDLFVGAMAGLAAGALLGRTTTLMLGLGSAVITLAKSLRTLSAVSIATSLKSLARMAAVLGLIVGALVVLKNRGEGVDKTIKEIADAGRKLAEAFGGNDGAINEVDALTDALKTNRNELDKSMLGLHGLVGNNDFSAFYGEITSDLVDLGREVDKTGEKIRVDWKNTTLVIEDSVGNISRAFSSLIASRGNIINAKELTQVITNFRNPLENFNAEMEKLNRLESFAKQTLSGEKLASALYAIGKAREAAIDNLGNEHEGISIVTRAYDQMSAGLVDALFETENAWESLKATVRSVVQQIVSDMLKLLVIEPIRRAVVQAIAGIMNAQAQAGAFGGGGGGGGGGGFWGSLFSIAGTAIGAYFGGPAGAAIGGNIGSAAGMGVEHEAARGSIFNRGRVTPFARGGIVSRPTLFPMASGAGLMGEAGPEAVIPLRRGSDGKLGVAGGGGTTVIIDARGSNGDAAVEAAVQRGIKQAAPWIVQSSVHKVRDTRLRNPNFFGGKG